MKFKSTLFLFYCLVISLNGLKAQRILDGGQNPIDIVVKFPYMHEDLFSIENLSWKKENRATESSPWYTELIRVNRKETNELFKEISTIKEGDTLTSVQYSYKFNPSNQVVEMENKSIMIPDTFYQKYSFDYTNGVLAKKIYLTGRYPNNLVPCGVTYSIFNTDGLRIKDSSMVFENNNYIPKLQCHYGYDNNKLCVSESYSHYDNQTGTWGDTVKNFGYEYYTDGKLKIWKCYTDNPNQPSLKKEYTYTQDGKIDEIKIYSLRNAAYKLTTLYKHYYKNGKLDAYVTKDWSINSIKNQDSTIVIYSDGSPQFAYQYFGDGEKWKNEVLRRLVFYNANTGINETLSPKSKLNAYPNPATSTVFVEITPEKTGSIDFIITDITGKRIKSSAFYCTANEANTVAIPLDGMDPGIYFLNAGLQTAKIVVE